MRDLTSTWARKASWLGGAFFQGLGVWGLGFRGYCQHCGDLGKMKGKRNVRKKASTKSAPVQVVPGKTAFWNLSEVQSAALG